MHISTKDGLKTIFICYLFTEIRFICRGRSLKILSITSFLLCECSQLIAYLIYKILQHISVYSTAKLFGCFHFALFHYNHWCFSHLSFYVRRTLASCWPPLPEITRPPLQNRSWKILNMDNEPYSKLMDGSMCLSKVTRTLKF